MKMRLFLLSLVILLAVSVAGVFGEVRVQLRYKPDPDTTWLTEGRLRVKTELTSTDGATTRADELYDLAWEDRVVSRDSLGTVTQARQIKTWMQKGGQNEAPSEVYHLSLSKLAEQKLASLAGTSSPLDQPALYPVGTVGVGDTWPIDQTSRSRVPVGSRTMAISTRVHGTGKLLQVQDGVALLEYSLKLVSVGPVNLDGTPETDPWAETSSTSDVHWTMKVDLASGVAIDQKTESTTAQTVSIHLPDEGVYPSRTQTTLELTSARL